MKNTELSNFTIKLQEIEDPEKGRGCSVHASGRASDRALAKMFVTMFEALEKEHTAPFISAMTAFMMKDLSEEDFLNIIR